MNGSNGHTPRAIVVGSGAGGATVAKELQGKFQVTVLESGKEFLPFSMNLTLLEKLRKTGLIFDEREIQLLFPNMRIRKTEDKMVLVNGMGLGGTTTLCTGNALRTDRDLRSLGINLDEEFEKINQEIPITTAHQKGWRKFTRRLFEIFQGMNLEPQPTPKMGNYDRCTHCGHCVLGCPKDVKWDSRKYLKTAIDRGAQLVTGCKVESVRIEDGKAVGIRVRKGLGHQFYPAHLIVLAAGGLGTPVILQNSGIACEQRLFVDPVLCVAARFDNVMQHKEIPMPFVSQKDGYILSPYFDYLSFFFNKTWRYPAKDIVSIMIKLADSNRGGISGKKIDKFLAVQDKKTLQEAVDISTEVLVKFGVDKDSIFLGTLNAGHPGGMLPLTVREALSFHSERLPENVYVADASLFPASLGNPPMLTIMAMAKRISSIIMQKEWKYNSIGRTEEFIC